MIRIKNLRFEKMEKEYDVRVDRRSILGNPYYMHSEEERDEVCEKYKAYFYKKIEEDMNFKTEIDRLANIYRKYGQLNLFCWCAPKRCHAETIKEYLENTKGE